MGYCHFYASDNDSATAAVRLCRQFKWLLQKFKLLRNLAELGQATFVENYSQRKLSTFESGQYCIAVNETLLSAFCGHLCPDA